MISMLSPDELMNEIGVKSGAQKQFIISFVDNPFIPNEGKSSWIVEG